MPYRPGDVLGIHAPIAGYRKYHLCLVVAAEGQAAKFLFMNSDPEYEDCYAVDCNAVPFLPVSETGKTCFSFSMIPRYNMAQLQTYQAENLGTLDIAIVRELYEFSSNVRALPRPALREVREALAAIISDHEAASDL